MGDNLWSEEYREAWLKMGEADWSMELLPIVTIAESSRHTTYMHSGDGHRWMEFRRGKKCTWYKDL